MLSHKIIFIILLFSISGLLLPPLSVDAQSNTSIPAWIKSNAGWWASGQIDDATFVQGIQFLIKQRIINIPQESKRLTDCNVVRASIGLSAQSNIDNGCSLVNVKISGMDLNGVDLSGANLSGADLSKANLSSANLHKVDSSNAKLSNANLSGANLFNANLSGANLSNANLSYAILTGTHFSNANLTDADLRSVNARSYISPDFHFYITNFSNSNLSGANLSNADLYSADFVNANLTDALLTNTTLGYANFNGAINQPTGNFECFGTPVHATFTCIVK